MFCPSFLSSFQSRPCTRKFISSFNLCKRAKTSNYREPVSCGKTIKWRSIVGLEVHAQICSHSKLFSGASTDFGAAANSNVSFFDAAIPGTLPVLNKRCVEAAVLTALALSCKINSVSTFDRKHYFYADLPAGYQITQQRAPIAEGGVLNFHVFTPGKHTKPYMKSSRIKQIQLEQDSGKSLHDSIEKLSLVDLNRAGIPLMELVFEPDLNDGEEAAALIKELSVILQRIRTCSCKMEEGALRVDANVSVHQEGEPFGVRTEIKNISSIRGVANAVQYEIQRQINILNKGGVIENETRAWIAEHKQTAAMRDKEVKQDYRFMPEPNLPPLRLWTESYPQPSSAHNLVSVEEIKVLLPELPEETRQKLIKQYGLPPEIALNLVNDDALLKYFFEIVKTKERDPKLTANILLMNFLEVLNKNKLSVTDCSVPSKLLGELTDLLQEKIINLHIFKKLLNELIFKPNSSPTQIVKERGWTIITDKHEIRKLCCEIIQRNPKMVSDFKAGKNKMFNAIVGQVAKETDQRADMESVVKELKKLLSK